METFFCIVLCVMGLALFFLRKYAGRTDKTAEPNWKFWWNDNKVDLISAVLVVTILMTLMLMGSISLDLDTLVKDYSIPYIVILSPKLAISAIIGYFGTNWMYGKFSKG